MTEPVQPVQFHYADPAMVAVPPAWTFRVTPHPSIPKRGPDLPVSVAVGAVYKTILRIPILDVQPGDVFDIYARWRVTSEVPYAVGIGTHLWWYDAELGSSSPWTRIEPWDGENVVKSPIHHKPLHLSTTWRVPANWIPGRGIVIAVRGDAHSTAAVEGDYVKTDGDDYSHLRVLRWTMPEVP